MSPRRISRSSSCRPTHGTTARSHLTHNALMLYQVDFDSNARTACFTVEAKHFVSCSWCMHMLCCTHCRDCMVMLMFAF